MANKYTYVNSTTFSKIICRISTIFEKHEGKRFEIINKRFRNKKKHRQRRELRVIIKLACSIHNSHHISYHEYGYFIMLCTIIINFWDCFYMKYSMLSI